MEFQIEENVKYTVYPYEHPFDDAWRIELGGGDFYYIYKDHEPFLRISVPTDFHSDAVIFHDNLVIGGDGIFIIDLKGEKKSREDFRIRNIKIDGYFGYLTVDRDVLYVLGMHHVYAFDSNLNLLWKSDDLSTDGVVLKSITDDTMVVSCNYDPMEKWFAREISLKDGKIIK